MADTSSSDVGKEASSSPSPDGAAQGSGVAVGKPPADAKTPMAARPAEADGVLDGIDDTSPAGAWVHRLLRQTPSW
ncbi:MAG: hypothetical protein ACYTG0_41710, partial [Planctomycetota bacterium]